MIPQGLGGKLTPNPHPGLAIHQAPVVIELKPGAIPVRKHQYPLPLEARVGILPHISRLKQESILIECQSAWNTPILPVKKEGGQDYRPVQDLRLVNQATVTTSHHSNPYTLLSLLRLNTKIYTCLDPKDSFFPIILSLVSQPIFAFEWEDPAAVTKQLTWTRLPRGLKNSPTIFGEDLASDLDSFHPERFRSWLLQYVDDLLLAVKNGKDC